MKKWCILLGSLSILLFSCTKNDLISENSDDHNTIRPQASDNSVYVSGWEKIPTWKYSDSAGYRIYYFNRETPQLTSEAINNGVVLTYSKVSTPDPEYQIFTKPIMLPFYFLPPHERPINAFYWYDMNTPGITKVAYQIRSSKQDMPEMGGGVSLPEFQFRYFIISKAYLDSKGVDAKTVRHHYTYQQLLSFLGMSQ
jgi:hypothetical protein